MFITIDQRIRLVGGTVPNEGRVEVRAGCNSDWGTVCDDLWGTTDAQVACRQLGYGTDGAIAYSFARFGQGTGEIFLDNVQCTGSETSIFDCQSNGFGNHNCAHFEDAGIFCPTSKQIIVCVCVRVCVCMCMHMHMLYVCIYVYIYIYIYI